MSFHSEQFDLLGYALFADGISATPKKKWRK